MAYGPNHNYRMKKQPLRILLVVLALIFSSSLQVSSASAADSQISGLVKRLNSKGKLWNINTASNSQIAIQSRQRLGLYQQPNAVIECNLRMSGTWLFIYKNWNQGYQASDSNYFYRTNYYNAEYLYDPKSNYYVILHTSMGGNQQCLDSAFRILEYVPQD
jgi:hypothetical protein